MHVENAVRTEATMNEAKGRARSGLRSMYCMCALDIYTNLHRRGHTDQQAHMRAHVYIPKHVNYMYTYIHGCQGLLRCQKSGAAFICPNIIRVR